MLCANRERQVGYYHPLSLCPDPHNSSLGYWACRTHTLTKHKQMMLFHLSLSCYFTLYYVVCKCCHLTQIVHTLIPFYLWSHFGATKVFLILYPVTCTVDVSERVKFFWGGLKDHLKTMREWQWGLILFYSAVKVYSSCHSSTAVCSCIINSHHNYFISFSWLREHIHFECEQAASRESSP